MCRTLSFKVDSGMDSVMRVLATLRRKQFEIKEFTMKEHNEGSMLNVTLESAYDAMFAKAIQNVKKLEDVYEVTEVC